jgi:hypothetical protein
MCFIERCESETATWSYHGVIFLEWHGRLKPVRAKVVWFTVALRDSAPAFRHTAEHIDDCGSPSGVFSGKEKYRDRERWRGVFYLTMLSFTKIIQRRW